MKWIARLILFLVIPTLVWVTMGYLGGLFTLAELLTRLGALLLAALLMFSMAR